jgi:hypothetical protein
MSNSLRVLLIVVGGALLLPGACSMGYTPITVMSLFGYGIGLGDPSGMFAFGVELIPRLSEGRSFAPETHQMMAVAPVFVAIGAFLLWRAWCRRSVDAGA